MSDEEERGGAGGQGPTTPSTLPSPELVGRASPTLLLPHRSGDTHSSSSLRHRLFDGRLPSRCLFLGPVTAAGTFMTPLKELE